MRGLFKQKHIPTKVKPAPDLAAMAKRINALPGEKVPADLASNLDKYLYGKTNSTDLKS